MQSKIAFKPQLFPNVCNNCVTWESLLRHQGSLSLNLRAQILKMTGYWCDQANKIRVNHRSILKTKDFERLEILFVSLVMITSQIHYFLALFNSVPAKRHAINHIRSSRLSFRFLPNDSKCNSEHTLRLYLYRISPYYYFFAERLSVKRQVAMVVMQSLRCNDYNP